MDSNVEQSPKLDKSFSQWLEKLQQESWQLELIISGIALFGIWEARTGIGQLFNYIQVYSTSSYADFAWIVICLLYTSPSPRDLSTSRMPSSA